MRIGRVVPLVALLLHTEAISPFVHVEIGDQRLTAVALALHIRRHCV